jgi:1-deoxy-D-xylulose-5-phosphate reductoisomerase
VGHTTAQVVRELRDKVGIVGLVAHRQIEALWAMGVEFGAQWVGVTDVGSAERLRAMTDGHGPRILAGMEAIVEAIQAAPTARVLGAMSGFSGLVPTLAAVEAGMDVLLANKETLVAAGALVMEKARQTGSQIIPVDSEHSAIFQCLRRGQPVSRIILTCSGGPFRGFDVARLARVTPADALNHPTWNMGAKITIDSATLMNKGLEVIEAHWLFDTEYLQLSVVIHPESVVHSMVEFADGATMAQLGQPDMRVPVAVALAWPERWTLAVAPFSWPGTRLTFEEPDVATFRALAVARQVGEAGGLLPCVMNAANEVAVEAFLENRLAFLDIVPTIERVLERWSERERTVSLDAIKACDGWARREAQRQISR